MLPAAVAGVLAAATLLAAGSRPATPARRDGEMTVALTGDTVLTRTLRGHAGPDDVALLSLLRDADAAFTNLETLFHDFEGPAMPSKPSLRSDPRLARDLAWAGFDLVARANNHAGDYGAAGSRETTRHVAAAGLTQAGAGESLAAARRAAIFRGAAGSVALVAATSSFPDFARAGNPRGPIPARPGVSPLRVQTTNVVTREQLETLRAIEQELGLSPPPEGHPLNLGELHFAAGEKPGVESAPDPEDLQAIAAEVRRASGSARLTIVSIHCHEAGDTRESPPLFLVTFAHAMIDAGADAVVGHGPHVLRGIEIYRGRPILYSLGNFVFEYETVSELPSDDYESVRLPSTARPDDFFDRYDQGGARGYPADADVWESVVAIGRWNGRELRALELHPISLGFGEPRGQRGRPRIAGADLSRKIVERLERLSRPFGTKIDLAEGLGRVVLPSVERGQSP